MTREEQFAFIASAKASVLASARRDGIPLHRIEFVVPFVDDDFGLWVWFFYETDDQLQSAVRTGWSEALKAELLRALRSTGYAEEWLDAVGFAFDSHENVLRDYEGSYFYRLR